MWRSARWMRWRRLAEQETPNQTTTPNRRESTPDCVSGAASALRLKKNNIVAETMSAQKKDSKQLIHLKASNGKFVCSDLGQNAELLAKSDHAWGWEIFQMIAVGEKKVNLISSTGKFVSADQNAGNILIANRDNASDWETFEIEIK